jgi:hypothetical protein
MIIETPEEMRLCQSLLTEEEADWLEKCAGAEVPDEIATEEECEISQRLIARGIIYQDTSGPDFDYDYTTELGRVLLACYQAANKERP